MDKNTLTEKEAIGFICPYKTDSEGLYCIASDCMAWIWTVYKSETQSIQVFNEDTKLYCVEKQDTKIPSHGKCALIFSRR